MRCKHCGQEHPDTFKFCPVTGETIESQQKYCSNPNCDFHEPLSYESKFCPNCGCSLTSEPTKTYESSKLSNLKSGGALTAAKKINNESKGILGANFVSKFKKSSYNSTTSAGLNPLDRPFTMSIDDIFEISGRGVIAAGRITTGRIHVGDEVKIAGKYGELSAVVTGVEMFRKLLDAGEAGDNVGLLLRGISKEELEPGMFMYV